MTRLSDKTKARLRNAAWWVAFVVVIVAVRAWQTRNTASGDAPAIRAERGNVESLARGGRVITVASASGGSDAVGAYVRQHRMAAPIVVDESGALARVYGVTAYPTTFYLDPDGRIRHVEVGYTTTLGMRARLALAGVGL
jgi:AhpC/TSA family